MLASVAAARRRWMFRDDENTFYMSTPYGAPAPGQFGGPPIYRPPATTPKNIAAVAKPKPAPKSTQPRQNGTQLLDPRSPVGSVPQQWRPGVGPRPEWDSLPWRPPIQDENDRPPVRRRSQLILESPTFPGYEGLTTTGPHILEPPSLPSKQGSPPHVHFNRIADIDEKECREALLDFVTESSCYGQTPAQQMKITSIKPATALHYVLETFCEARTARYVSEPYRGDTIDGPENGQPPRPWQMSCQKDQMFVDRVAEMEVPHTATIQRCSACDDRGCQRCWRCRGWGQVRCHQCNGDGAIITVPEAGENNVQQDKCFVCAGEGQKSCVTCDGEGALTCDSCDGYGRLKCYILLTATFVTYIDDYNIEETDMPEELMKNLRGMSVFEQNLPQIWPIVNYSNAEINENSRRLVEQHKCAFPNAKMLRQRHCLSAVPVTEVHYEWHYGKGRFYVFGQERKVHAPDYPQQCCWGCTVT